ncbi:MAG TPA: ATP-binding protein [Chthoniobacterales bacterium]|nr:ATP-binding protein [Chthoniobacterales bacterium]
MAGKLRRFSATTQEALKQLTCLGNVAEVSTLTLVQGETEEVTHAALWEAVHAGLVFREDNVYKFLHDRIQQAAYALIPEEHRAEVHLRIARVLLASMTADDLTEHLFDVANQFNRGASRLVERDEKKQVAAIDLRAGRKAKASAAFVSACVYLAAGVALVDDGDWGSQYELMFSLWLERAECEFLSGNFDKAEQLITELLQRATSKVDQAAAYHLKVQLHIVKGEYPQALATALPCLRLFGIDIPAHPTWEQVQVEYGKTWQNLGKRSIESLIDLPLMNDPEMQTAMRVLAALTGPALYTDKNLLYLHLCHMVNVSLTFGTTDACTHGYIWFGLMLGQLSHRYADGYRFGKVACELVEKHEFLAYKAKTYFGMEIICCWTQPLQTAISFIRSAFDAAVETGDLTFACYSCNHLVTDLLFQGVHLDEVWRESEKCLHFDRKVKFRDAADIIVSQQRFIQNMRGNTLSFSSLSDAQFDEEAFESQLTEDRMATMVCWYWILKLEARFMSGDYAEALAAAEKAKVLISASYAHIQLLGYHYYSALVIAALYPVEPPERQSTVREELSARLEQLREWAESCPETFLDKYRLVSAELARIEGRDLDAMRLYEEAIRTARENGFVQNEGVANELAAQFYLKRGIEKVAHSYLRDARYCYLRWGALGKVKQLSERYPAIEEQAAVRPTITIGTSVEQLDLETVMKASHAVAGEIVLEKLIKTLMMIAVEHAGAERGLLILSHGEDLRIAAEARTGHDGVDVQLQDALVTPSELPDSLLRYVIRTQESVILDDAPVQNLFLEDGYVREQHPRSVLCLPLVKQAKLIGVLYLENKLVPRAFTPKRLAMLELLASQAAISLENTRLYRGLEERESKIRRLVDANIMGIYIWNLQGEILEANEAFLHLLGYSREDLVSDGMRWTDLTPSEWRDRDEQAQAELKATGTIQPFEKEYVRKDGSRVPVLLGCATFEGSGNEGVAFVLDLSKQKCAEDERKRAEDALQEAQAALAHVTRVTTLGELIASIAHEINQPLGAVVNNASACLRWLAAQNLEEARESATLVIANGHRAGEIIGRIRALAKKAPPQKDWLDLNQTIGEVIAMASSEVRRNRISLQTQLANDLPLIRGDKIQLQQVILNLLINAIEAIAGVSAGPRELLVSSEKVAEIPGESPEDRFADKALAEAPFTHVLIAVRDSGPGLDPKDLDRLFEAFYTTKPHGLGMGLAISRSIIEAHGGWLWAKANAPKGAIFQFALPIGEEWMS